MILSKKCPEVHPGLVAIRKFVIRNHLSSFELKQALSLFMGSYSAKELAKSTPPHQVYQLADLVKLSVESGMKLSDFKALIQRWKQHDRAEEDFETLVQSLKTSEDEKEILRSIVQNCLYGVLKIQDVDAGEPDVVRIPHQEVIPTPRDVACGLLHWCGHLKGKKVEVAFRQIQ